jgi:hypothetical protein
MTLLDVCVGAVLVGYIAWALTLSSRLSPPPRPVDRPGNGGAQPRFGSLGWTAGGVAFLALLVFVGRNFGGATGSAEALVRKAERIELVERMRSMIAEACDAESSAVMSADAKDARASVDRSRAAIEETAKAEAALGRNLEKEDGAKKALEDFERSFAEFEQVGRELGSLAPKNTNGEARDLASGPAAEAVDRMDVAAARLAAKNGNAARLALGAVVAARRAEVLLPLHIAEASDAGMDRLESRMDEADREARRDLDELRALPAVVDDADYASLSSAFQSFRDVRARILALSRENTNVRSLEIAAGKLRAAKIRCQDALDELQRSIHDAPVPGVRATPPFNPRRLRAETPSDGVHS